MITLDGKRYNQGDIVPYNLKQDEAAAKQNTFEGRPEVTKLKRSPRNRTNPRQSPEEIRKRLQGNSENKEEVDELEEGENSDNLLIEES